MKGNALTRGWLRNALRRALAALVAAGGLALSAAAARADTVIVQDDFYYNGWMQHINSDNRKPDIANLPSNTWVVVSANPSYASDPYIPGSGWGDWCQNSVNMQHSLNSISISIGGYNTGRLRISANIAISAISQPEGMALGFKASAPASGLVTGVDPRMDFTGLRINGDGVITLVVNGVAQSGTASVGALTDKHYYPFSYDVDTASGDIYNIKFNGGYVPDFATTAFTTAATTNAGVLTGNQCSGAVDNFTVTALDAGEGTPVVNNASGATGIIGSSATLNGALVSGTRADVYVYWGTDPNNWANTNAVGSVNDGLFSKSISGLRNSTTYYYRCFASNSVSTAWADAATNFLSGAPGFTWTGAAGNGFWNDPNNWNPNTGFPNAARETATFVYSGTTPTTVYLNQATVTVGGISMTPGAGTGGFCIATNASGQALVLDNAADPAYVTVLGGVTAGGTISAPVVLNSSTEVSTLTSGNNYALTFAGPVTGAGALIAKLGRIGFNPLQDTTYGVSISGIKSGGAVWKRGARAATFTGNSSVLFSGDNASAGTIGEGGQLVVSGGVLANPSTAGWMSLFSTANNNAMIVTNGGHLIYAAVDGAYPQLNFNAANNTVVVTGAGSLLNLNNNLISLNSDNGRMLVANGGHVTSRRGQIGWRTLNNAVVVTGASSLWDLVGDLLCMGVGAPAASNSLTIADGGVVQNTFLWMGYSYYNDGGGSYNCLTVSGGGKFYSGTGDDWGWGNCIGVSGSGSGYRAHHNTALVTGTGSLWDMQTKNLCIGLINADMAVGGWNSVQAAAGGMITNVNNLYVGRTINNGNPQGFSYSNDLTVATGGVVSASAVIVGDINATCNTLTLGGGSLRAGALTLNGGNKLVPLIGAAGVTPMTVSGAATLAAGSYLSPTNLPDAVRGSYTVLTAGSVVNNGLALDPAADPAIWQFTVDATSVKLTYRPRGSGGTLMLML